MTERFVIRVMNLAEDTNEDKIEGQLNNQGLKSKCIWIARYPSGLCAGYAFIDFETKEEMLRAKEHFRWVDVIEATQKDSI
jgi:hypothetical protein